MTRKVLIHLILSGHDPLANLCFHSFREAQVCIKVCFRIAIRLLSTPVLELVDSVEGFDSLWIRNSCPTLLLRFVSSAKVEPSSVLIALVHFLVVVAASRATEAFHRG